MHEPLLRLILIVWQVLRTEEHLAPIFKHLDQDESKTVDIAELYGGLKLYGVNIRMVRSYTFYIVKYKLKEGKLDIFIIL